MLILDDTRKVPEREMRLPAGGPGNGGLEAIQKEDPTRRMQKIGPKFALATHNATISA